MIPNTETLHTTLKQHFGYDAFRPNQQAIIDNVLAGNDTLVIMPTGGGKSMCYQLPALLLPGITVVISPLIALMKDQVDALTQNGIAAAYFHSQQSPEARQILHQSLNAGVVKLLYTAPESLNGLLSFVSSESISLLAVDEAHCISAWGHDFRPAYTQLADLKRRLNCPLIALTATADKTTRADIVGQLNMPDAVVFLSSFNRSNLSLNVVGGQKRLPKILAFLRRHAGEAGIIYCLSRKGAETLAEKLRDNGHATLAYHAGLPAQTRDSVQNRFISDDVEIICATIAFGMGIDKSNVRWVIHYNLPKNIEGYYQEIGRAGRDGLPAETLLFYSFADVMQLRQFAESSSPQQQTIQLAKLQRMQQYAEALTCRRKILLSYFGEHVADNCDNCDICLHPPEAIDGKVIAQKALSAIARLKQNEPLNVVIDLLRGSQNQYQVMQGYHQLKTHGVGKDIDWRDWQQYIIQLMNQGFIEIAYHDGNKLKLTAAAKSVLFDGQNVMLAKLVDAQERLKQPVQTAEYESSEPLFDALKTLRREIAEREDVPAYVVFSDATLRDMTLVRPRNDDDFLLVSGVGQVKLARYGEVFIDAIAEFIADNPDEDTPRQLPMVKPSPSKSSTIDATMVLYESGSTPQQIADQRGLKLSTIIEHLCKAYQLGKAVNLRDFITDSDLSLVQQAQIDLDSPSGLKPYFEHLGGAVDYDTLKIALFILENATD